MSNFISKIFSDTGKEVIKESFTGINNILDEVITNKEEKAEIKLKIKDKETELLRMDAQNPKLFVSGWRPFVGWVCGFGYGFNYIVRPIMNFALVLMENPKQMPPLDLSELAPLLIGMLGFGAYRSYEKTKNKARD